ncbi:MaoC/PaaZ C-terminal domain-containing protein [Rubrivivax albus]|uniref:MaoC-like domain-containing protein n=1 Tax=Rubrivivax albus TaxID=2499835 RepID=A0A3S2U8L0_9BURK|nr:MaoC/PaaZ C-terminal domain-containing protein [Rubrivivax albus]RVT51299.1 hypothetical protein ENE75_10660 [Rubrivivax albus]
MIDSAVVGLHFPRRETTVSTRRMLAYAAGIGDLTPAVFDDSAPDFMAHPALCVSLEWPVVSDPGMAATLVPEAADRLRAMHLIQDSTFHRPIRAGERLATGGTVTGVWRGNSGTRTACTLQTVDAQGAAIVTSRTVALYRGVEATGEDRPPAEEAPLPSAPKASECAGFESVLDIDAALPHRYTECAGIWNPIHTERRVARTAGLPDILVHGTATWAMAGSAIVARCAPGAPGLLRRLRGRFGALVMPRSALRLRASLQHDAEGCHVHFEVLTPAGDAAIADGYALLTHPAAHP